MGRQGPPETLYSMFIHGLGGVANARAQANMCTVACLDPRSDPREVFGLQPNGRIMRRWQILDTV
jgi:hypothetical protein